MEYEFEIFEKVLGRDKEYENWQPDFFRYKEEEDEYPYNCFRNSYRFCIPYKGNEPLAYKGASKNAYNFGWGDKVYVKTKDEENWTLAIFVGEDYNDKDYPYRVFLPFCSNEQKAKLCIPSNRDQYLR